MSKKITGNDLKRMIKEAFSTTGNPADQLGPVGSDQTDTVDQYRSKERERETKPRVPADSYTDEIPQSRGALGDIQIQDYGKEGRKIPSFYRDVFENSGILSKPSLEERVGALETYTNFLVKQKEQEGDLIPDSDTSGFSVEQEVGNVFVLDALGDILSQSTGRDASGLQDLGFLTEGFIALLFSGAKIGSDSGWTDVITDTETEGNFSIKFMAKKSTNYQALSTVYNHFQKTNESMRFLNIVKSAITKDYNEIKFFMTRFSKEDYEEATKGMQLLTYKDKNGRIKIKGAEDLKSSKALVTTDKVKYYFENPIAFAPTRDIEKTDLEYDTTALSAIAKIGQTLDKIIDTTPEIPEPEISTKSRKGKPYKYSQLKKSIQTTKESITKYLSGIEDFNDLNKKTDKTDEDKEKLKSLEKKYGSERKALSQKTKYQNNLKKLKVLEADLEAWEEYRSEIAKAKQSGKSTELRKSLRGDYEVEEGKEPRITFTEFGDLVATMTMPSLSEFNEMKTTRLKSLETKIVEITRSLKELQAAAVLFSSTSKDSDKKQEAASKVNEKFTDSKNLLAGELGEMSKIQESKDGQITANFLKKLIQETLKK
jgi:hypothetical protein